MNKEQEEIFNELTSKYNFDEWQKEQIILGLEEGLDVSWYANPKFNHYQMEQILYGLENNINVSLYANTEFTWAQMEQIRLGLKHGFDVSIYLNPTIDWREMQKHLEDMLKLKNKTPLRVLFNNYLQGQ